MNRARAGGGGEGSALRGSRLVSLGGPLIHAGVRAQAWALVLLAAGLLALAPAADAPPSASPEGSSSGPVASVEGPTPGEVGVSVSENHAPLAVDDVVVTRSGVAVSVDVLANDADADGDVLSVTGSGLALFGEVSCTGAGVCTYTPQAGYAGADSFVYTVSDAFGGTDEGAVAVTVERVLPPSLSIGDATLAEGDSGTKDAIFTVTLSAAAGRVVTVAYTAVSRSATAPADYVPASGTLVFAPGEPLAKTISVSVRGDTLVEADEVFYLVLRYPNGATIADGQGLGRIVNDDALFRPKLLFGFADDAVKWEPVRAVALATTLGARSFRITLSWSPGRTALTRGDLAELENAVASGMRIVVSVSGPSPPLTEGERAQYCTYVRDILARYPEINDVGIWNEPNTSLFWSPQFGVDGSSVSPAAYEALLARCWDTLHSFRAGVNVIGGATSSRGNDRPWARSNVSHSPGKFIRAIGDAYRLSGRTRPIFDTFGHHPYPETSSEAPWQEHTDSSTISEGDYGKLRQALYDAFHGTAQPIPGEPVGSGSPSRTKTVPIWYLEMGFQTVPDSRVRLSYVGAESDLEALVDVADPSATAEGDDLLDQAVQVVAAVRLAYCQPYVEAIFNFKLWDEQDLGRWQSAPLWFDRTRKDSFWAFGRVIAEANTGRVDCSQVTGALSARSFTPRTNVAVERIKWPRARRFQSPSPALRVRVEPGEDARYAATLYRLGKKGADPALRPRTSVLATTGQLAGGRLTVVRFPEQPLRRGAYEIEIVLTSKESSRRTTTRTSPSFVVRGHARAGTKKS